MSDGLYRCTQCDGTDVEICLPAFFKPNEEFRYVNVDYEASALNWFCNTCEESTVVRTPFGNIDPGRWAAGYPS
jgi:hypothetical protein